MDANEIVRELRTDAACNFNSGYCDRTCRKAADLIESLHVQLAESQRREQAAASWIPVSDRFPESGAHVLLSCVTRPSGKKYVCDDTMLPLKA